MPAWLYSDLSAPHGPCKAMTVSRLHPQGDPGQGCVAAANLNNVHLLSKQVPLMNHKPGSSLTGRLDVKLPILASLQACFALRQPLLPALRAWQLFVGLFPEGPQAGPARAKSALASLQEAE